MIHILPGIMKISFLYRVNMLGHVDDHICLTKKIIPLSLEIISNFVVLTGV